MQSHFNLAGPVTVDGQAIPRKKRALVGGLGVILWLSVAAGGLWFLWGYENAPGVAAQPPQQWPAASRIQPAPDRATLIMLAHPHCPCTRASIGELAAIMAHSQGRLNAYVVFVRAESSARELEATDLWQSASRIPGVQVVVDVDGHEAHTFQGATSGQAMLYDPKGRLVFTGGITASRGHFGDNAGASAIVSLVNAEAPERTETSVFGCPLFNPQSECQVPKDERNRR
jgi:hypothetical protein